MEKMMIVMTDIFGPVPLVTDEEEEEEEDKEEDTPLEHPQPTSAKNQKSPLCKPQPKNPYKKSRSKKKQAKAKPLKFMKVFLKIRPPAQFMGTK